MAKTKVLVPRGDEPRSEWTVMSARVHPKDLDVVDRAARKLRLKRSDFILVATLEKARKAA